MYTEAQGIFHVGQLDYTEYHHIALSYQGAWRYACRLQNKKCEMVGHFYELDWPCV